MPSGQQTRTGPRGMLFFEVPITMNIPNADTSASPTPSKCEIQLTERQHRLCAGQLADDDDVAVFVSADQVVFQVETTQSLLVTRTIRKIGIVSEDFTFNLPKRVFDAFKKDLTEGLPIIHESGDVSIKRRWLSFPLVGKARLKSYTEPVAESHLTANCGSKALGKALDFCIPFANVVGANKAGRIYLDGPRIYSLTPKVGAGVAEVAEVNLPQMCVSTTAAKKLRRALAHMEPAVRVSLFKDHATFSDSATTLTIPTAHFGTQSPADILKAAERAESVLVSPRDVRKIQFLHGILKRPRKKDVVSLTLTYSSGDSSCRLKGFNRTAPGILSEASLAVSHGTQNWTVVAALDGFLNADFDDQGGPVAIAGIPDQALCMSQTLDDLRLSAFVHLLKL